MSSRSEVLSIYKKFAAMVRTQFSTPIRVFHADSAGEYISRSLHAFLAEEGHRHLFKTARALMIAASLSSHFWAEAFSTATYLINIQPSAALQGDIPLERLSDRSLDYSALHLFACFCYVLLSSRERTKLTA
jgi:hypothetical protein